MKLDPDQIYESARMDVCDHIYITNTPGETFIQVSEIAADMQGYIYSDNFGSDDYEALSKMLPERLEDTVGDWGLPKRNLIAMVGVMKRVGDDAVAFLGRTDDEGCFIGPPAQISLGSWLENPSMHEVRGRLAHAIITDDELRAAVVQHAIEKTRNAIKQLPRVKRAAENERLAAVERAIVECYEDREQVRRRCIGATN